jgi:hypothetical protein
MTITASWLGEHVIFCANKIEIVQIACVGEDEDHFTLFDYQLPAAVTHSFHHRARLTIHSNTIGIRVKMEGKKQKKSIFEGDSER